MPYLVATEYVTTLPQAVPTITGSSVPLNIGEVATVIARVSAELDSAAAAAGYTVPVASTATVAYGQMQAFAEYGANCKVLRTFFPNMGGPADTVKVASDYCRAYENALLLLRSSAITLVGVETGEDGRELPRSYYTSHDTATAGVVPSFDLDWRP